MKKTPILNPNLPDVLTTTQLAEYLRVSNMTISRYEDEGAFKHFKRDKQDQRLFKKSDVENYLQSINQIQFTMLLNNSSIKLDTLAYLIRIGEGVEQKKRKGSKYAKCRFWRKNKFR